MTPTRIAIVGAGAMARRRAQAFLRTGRARICAVASRHTDTARSLAEEVGSPSYANDFHQIAATQPDAVLVEVPNAAQDPIVTWALEQGWHVLIGGPLACSVAAAEGIDRAARARGLVVEAGYEGRYKPVWETARNGIANGVIGRVIAVQTMALWDCRPESWYSRERETGGMPVAHMTYAFVNPLRWLFGEPTHVSALANRIKNTVPGALEEETCVANLMFRDSILGSMLAGFVKPVEPERWRVAILGTDGEMELCPSEMDSGHLTVRRGSQVETVDFANSPDAFGAQAEAFIDSLSGRRRCRNLPQDSIGDLVVAEAIVASARHKRTIRLKRPAVSALFAS